MSSQKGSWNLLRAALAFCFAVLAACTPAAVKSFTLKPVSENLVTADDIVRESEDLNQSEYDLEYLSRVVVFSSDSLLMAFRLEETRDVIYLYVWLHNGTQQSLDLSPDLFTLVDGGRGQFRRLSPHEAANIFLADVRGTLPYEPKYQYRVNTYSYGNYSRSTVTKQEDPGYALGYAIGAIIQERHDKKLTEMAGAMYALGLVDGTELAADANMDFGVYWLNEENKLYPLEVRIGGTELRVSFDNPR